jgi:N6-adenosine-specific RNA methylase IME4
MKFKVVLADPPWSYSQFKKRSNGSPQYQTMPFADIQNIPVARWADTDCLLVLWATWPLLNQGIELVKDWGFEYITGMPWVKTLPKAADISTGLGFWSQSCSEVLLLGRRGNVSPPKNTKHLGLLEGEPRSFYAPVSRRHSRKPEEIHQWIESNFEGPYLELFATQPREKWACWGLDLGVELTPEGVVTTEHGCKVLKDW